MVNYGRQWRRLRRHHLTLHPLCHMCVEEGRTTAATEVDHIQKHNGNLALFYDPTNLQSLCHDHHRGYKARIERSGKDTATDIHGNPINPPEHWR